MSIADLRIFVTCSNAAPTWLTDARGKDEPRAGTHRHCGSEPWVRAPRRNFSHGLPTGDCKEYARRRESLFLRFGKYRVTCWSALYPQ